MRILHTSDWHVGKTLRGRSRLDEHAAVLDEIVAIATDERVDLVLVVGDVFDTAAPAPEADTVAYRTLLRLAATGAEVLVVSGNHDNARRLQAHQPLLDLGKVTVRATFAGPDDGGVVTGVTRGGEAWRVACVPFLSQRFVVHSADLIRADGADHAGSYAERVAQIVGALTEGCTPDTVNLVAAHLFVDGGMLGGTRSLLGGGERSAHTIFDYAVSPASFGPSTHYVALGHLHRAQAIAGPCPIRYCGSPLQLDFGEVADEKSVTIVDASPGTPAKTRVVPLRRGRRLRTVRGTLPELQAVAAAGAAPVDAAAENPDEAGAAGAAGESREAGGPVDAAAENPGEASGAGEAGEWLRVIVRARPKIGLVDDVRALFPEAVDVLVEDPSAGDWPKHDDAPSRARAGRNPGELFAEYLAERDEDDSAVRSLFDRLLDEVVSA